MVAAAIVIAYSSFTMLRKAMKAPKGNQEPTASIEPDGRQAPAIPTAPVLSKRQLVEGFAIGLVAGVASGYVGLGGGFLMVPLMVSWIGLPMKLSSGTSLIGIVLLAIPGAIEQGLLGNIDHLVGIATAVGTVPGAFIGARLITRVPERTLRILFSIFLGIGAILLVARELALFV